MKRAVGLGLGVALTLAVAHAHDPITTRVTWNGEVARIVGARCIGCHSPDGRGPMSLATYEDARPWAKAIKEEVMTRRMPKWHAVRGYGDFKNDPSLSLFEIALITAWADGGAPKGAAPDRPGGEKEKSHLAKAQPPVSEQNIREVALPCGERPLPEGTLLGLHPMLEKDQSVGVAVRRPDGRRELVAWIRAFDPEFPTTYWLRRPLLLPRGATGLFHSSGGACSVRLVLQR